MTFFRNRELRSKFNWVVFFSLFIFFCGTLWAYPPTDQILLEPAPPKGIRVIRNKNVTYTQDQPETSAKGAIKTRFAVKGRSRPNRSGKVLTLLQENTPVVPFRWSRDKMWIAVKVESSQVRAWIPKSALPELTDKLQLSTRMPTTGEPPEPTSATRKVASPPPDAPEPTDQPAEGSSEGETEE